MTVKEAIDVLERNCDFHYEETDKCYGCKFENSGWCDEDFHDSLLALLKEQDEQIKLLEHQTVDNNGKFNAHETLIGKALDAGHIYR